MPVAREIALGSTSVPMPEFLRFCADQVAARPTGAAGGCCHGEALEPDPGLTADLARACRVFVDGGLAALRQSRDSKDWLQYDLSVGGSDRRECYAALLTVVQALRAADRVVDFFFMHKPPGLRIRFHAAAGERATVDEAVRDHLAGWQANGLVLNWQPAYYEPEQDLFGGPVSMASVHRLFTIDSLTWLAYHSAADPPDTRGPGPTWAMSLLMLRSLFDAMGIVGWEDLDVWNRVRWQTGRRLAPAVTDEVDLKPLTTALRSGWYAPAELTGLLSPGLHPALAAYQQAVAAIGPRWLREYFHSGAARLGPRAAAAYLVIFHWNRAGLPSGRQNLMTEALAVHPALAEPK